jgi:hypothetical protein
MKWFRHPPPLLTILVKHLHIVMAIGHDTSFSLSCTFLFIHTPLTCLFPPLTFLVVRL